ncbi:MAG: dephospho-CoA kinase [Fibrobacter sp.]|jgi:dephospho-CoA kinase|nr:dephospho-CoA kinase [Fibrobacter sp.]
MKSIKIALAGYMGSGKTTCARFFADAGAMLINADLEAKALMESEPKILQELKAEFGDSILENDKISYSRLGSIVFGSVEPLLKLNSITHPPLLKKLKKLLSKEDSRIVVLDAALIPLWNIDSWFDFRIWVEASRQIRMNRILKKNPNIKEAQLIKRMDIQESTFSPPSPWKWSYISNEDSVESLGQKVFLFLQQINRK